MNGRKITSMLLGLSLLSVVGGSLFISSFQNNVTITPNILYGDSRVVEDLTLHLSSYFERDSSNYSLDMLTFLDTGRFEHSWDIEIPLSEPENSRSNYQFQQERTSTYWSKLFYFHPYMDLHFYFNWIMTPEGHLNILAESSYENTFLPKLLDLAERAQKENLSQLTEVVPLMDYLEEYKIGTSVFANHNGKTSNSLTEKSKQWMADTFQSAVSPDHVVELTVNVNDDNEVRGEVDYPSTGFHFIESHTVGSGLSGYFSHQLVVKSFDEEYNPLPYKSDDVAKLYRVVLEPADNSKYPLLEIQTLEEIGTLPERQRIVSMCLTQENNLAVLVEDLDSFLLTLYFYDPNTFSLLSSFPLISSDDCDFSVYLVDQQSEGICVTVFVDDVRTVWVWKEHQGNYELFFDEMPVSSSNILEEHPFGRTSITKTDFINDKFLVIQLIQGGNYLQDYPMVAVFDETGLNFLAEYHSSQNLTVEQYVHGSENVKPFNDPSISR